MSGIVGLLEPVEVVSASADERKIEMCTQLTDFPEVLTLKDVKTIVERAWSPGAEVISYTLHPYSDEKIGFLGSHLRLEIKVREQNEKILKSLDFFVKCVPYDISTQADYIRERGVFSCEAVFYNEIVPHLLYKRNGPVWGPRCHLVKDDVLVFEELRNKGFSMRGKLYNEQLTIAGLTAIARLHAASLIAETRLGEPLNQLYPHAFVEKVFLLEGRQHQWYNAGVELAVAMAKQLDLNPTRIPAAIEGIFDAVKPSRSARNVVTHADLWTNNLMFNNDEPPRCIVVDFQLVRYCSPAQDVVQFLYLCTSRELRKTKEKAMMKHYYDVLLEELKGADIHVIPPSWMDLLRGVEEQRLGALVTAAFFLPIVLLDGKFSAKLVNDPVSYEKFIFLDRRDIVLNNMKRDLGYSSRIGEIITELHELASHLDDIPKPS